MFFLEEDTEQLKGKMQKINSKCDNNPHHGVRILTESQRKRGKKKKQSAKADL